ncbi:MAG TPA: GcrA family cell cycle regulator [Xanthobacteraceae bacterium]|nr:GcrA family cell cycle regulator [Xanthobacteraceae bacterium]
MTIATWTPERVEQLRTCIATGLTCSEIAAEIGVTRNSVIGKIHRLGLSPGRPVSGSVSGPAREHAPRARRSRPSSQRQLLRLIFADRASPDRATNADLTNVAATASVESTRPCSLLELAACKCRWPMSNGSATAFVFCGNEAVGGLPYCAGHARMAYRIPGRRA